MTAKWRNCTIPEFNVYMAPRTDTGPIRLFDVIADAACDDIVITGQNCWSVIHHLEKSIRDYFLDSERTIRFILNDPKNEECLRAWSTVSGGHGGIKFEDDLTSSMERLAALRQELGKRTLDYRMVPIMPLSACFVNPTRDNALLLITPIALGSYRKEERPQVVIMPDSETNKRIIAFYWDTVKPILERKSDEQEPYPLQTVD